MLHTEKPETTQVDTTTKNSGNNAGASSRGDKDAGRQRPGINKQLLEKRYVQGDEKTWRDVVSRVANHAGRDSGRTEEFIDLISAGKFFPSRMTYMGTDYPFASSCFVFPVEDSLTGIMQTLSDACQVQKYGGGCIGGVRVV
jgi:ribonucleotide reductase alpha subunit